MINSTIEISRDFKINCVLPLALSKKKNVIIKHLAENDLKVYLNLVLANYQDVLPAILPFYHIYGLTIVMLNGLVNGSKLVSLPKLDSETFLNILKDHKV